MTNYEMLEKQYGVTEADLTGYAQGGLSLDREAEVDELVRANPALDALVHELRVEITEEVEFDPVAGYIPI